MAKQCGTFEHTADLGLSARADSLGELLEALGEGLAAVICPPEQVQPAQVRTVEARSEDAEALAVDFLVEVMNAVQADRFMVHHVSARAGEWHVRAELHGEPYDADRHAIDREVKAVTYHALRIERVAEQWEGEVILDL